MMLIVLLLMAMHVAYPKNEILHQFIVLYKQKIKYFFNNEQ